MENQPPTNKRRGRSPGYPAIDLEDAILKTEKLYNHVQRNFAHIDVVLGYWGIKPKSGLGLSIIAALLKFGLLESKGGGSTRQVRLTDLALDIILDKQPESLQRQTAIREAALMPEIHQSLCEEYPDSIPADEALSYHLQRNMNFTPAGAQAFIKEFKTTFEFAKLAQSNKANSQSIENFDQGLSPDLQTSKFECIENGSPEIKPTKPAISKGVVEIRLPVSLSEYAFLRGFFPMAKEKWEQMIKVLEAMKPALVVEKAVNGDENPPSEQGG